jgi:hypothetical protein
MSVHGTNEGLRHGVARSPEWPKVEKDVLEKHPQCTVCTATHGLQVHHIIPFHYVVALGRPDLELDERNLIVLCETEEGHVEQNHHLLIGHLDDFKSSNLNVVEDATKKYYGYTADAIRYDLRWRTEKMHKLKALDEMTMDEKAQLRKLMDDWFPLEKSNGTA